MRPSLLAALLALTLASAADAQIIEARGPHLLDQWFWGASFFGGFAQGDFRKHDKAGAGGSVMVAFQPFRRQPLSFRADFGSYVYGSVTAQAQQQVCDVFSCRTETVDYRARTHTMNFAHFGPEFFMTDGRLRPFLNATVGYAWFHSWASLPPPGPDQDGDSQTLLSSTNISAAYGGGLRIVSQKFGREVGFELSGRVTRNVKATYLTEDGIQQQPDSTYLVTPNNTGAHVLGIHVGFFMGPFINWNERRPKN